jgi:phosphotriesterase-related protein
MKTISTTLGKISANELGETLCHEHVFCANPAFVNAFGNSWFPKDEVIERAVELFTKAKTECGVNTVIDCTPIDLGRDVEIIREVSQKTGINFIVSTGMYHNEETFLHGKKPENLATYYINEYKNGIKDTGIRPEILKCATGYCGVTPVNEMLLSAVAIAHKNTGMTICAHNEHAVKTAYAQLKIFRKYGVDMEKVIIGHCSDSYDCDYLEDLLSYGCYLAFDRIYPNKYEEQAKTISTLIQRGHEDKLLVSHDFFAFYDFGDTDLEKQKGFKRDFTIVHKKLFPYLSSLGIAKDTIQKLTVHNPKTLMSK